MRGLSLAICKLNTLKEKVKKKTKGIVRNDPITWSKKEVKSLTPPEIAQFRALYRAFSAEGDGTEVMVSNISKHKITFKVIKATSKIINEFTMEDAPSLRITSLSVKNIFNV